MTGSVLCHAVQLPNGPMGSAHIACHFARFHHCRRWAIAGQRWEGGQASYMSARVPSLQRSLSATRRVMAPMKPCRRTLQHEQVPGPTNNVHILPQAKLRFGLQQTTSQLMSDQVNFQFPAVPSKTQGPGLVGSK